MSIFDFLKSFFSSSKRNRAKRSKEANSSVIKSYEFVATMQLRTPKWILEKHGEVKEGAKKPPLPCDKKHGIWVPKTKSWKELGIEGPGEISSNTMASEVGQIPSDGGDFLPFLIEFRTIIESDKSIDKKINEIKALSENKDYRKFIEELGPDLAQQWYISQIQNLPGVGGSKANDLYRNGYRTLGEISKATVDDLQKISGIGEKTAETIKDKASEMTTGN